MPITSVFDEDHLRPIATVDGNLFLFSSLDGSVYWLSGSKDNDSTIYKRLDLADIEFPFCIPGIPIIYDVCHSATETCVSAYPIRISGLDSPQIQTYATPSPLSYRFNGLIPNAASNSVSLVFASLSGEDDCLLLDTLTGDLERTGSDDAIPSCIFSDGTVALQSSDSRWSIRNEGTTLWSGDGRIISTASDFVVAVRANKAVPEFVMISRRQQKTINAPEGWSIISLAASDQAVLAYAVHPEEGQALLEANPTDLFFSILGEYCGTTQLFGMGAAVYPVARSTGIVIGSGWRMETALIQGISAPRCNYRLQHLNLQGIPCVIVGQPRYPSRRLIVALHGGPDSHELDDLRYGGGYRKLIDAGSDLLIVNYPGSTGFGDAFHSMAWGAWDEAGEAVAGVVYQFARHNGYHNFAIFGVSFGSWIALKIAKNLHEAAARPTGDRKLPIGRRPEVSKVVLMSPILDLQHHLDLHVDSDESFRIWAESRFGPGVAETGEGPVLACPSPVVVIAPEDDEVILPKSTQASTLAAQAAGRDWTIQNVPGRHYPSAAHDAEVRWATLFKALN